MTSRFAAMISIVFALGGCAGSTHRVGPHRVIGPTLPVPELTPDALGLQELPPKTVTYANRAWSSKPGMLLSLANLVGALQKDMHLSKITQTELVVVASAINQCVY